MANKKKKYYKQYSNAKQKKHYGKTVAAILFALLFIASVVGGVFGWIKVGKYKAQLDKLAAEELPNEGKDKTPDDGNNEGNSGGKVDPPDDTDNKDGKDDKDDKDDVNAANMLMTLSDNYAEMSLAAFSAPSSQKRSTITATVEPAELENKIVNFSLSMKDGTSAAEYMSMEVDGNTATVYCLKAFPQQIVLTATADVNPNLSETCTFDYLCGISDFDNKYDFPGYWIDANNGDGTVDIKPVYGVGTICPEDFEITAVYWKLSDEFVSAIQGNYYHTRLVNKSLGGYSICSTNKAHLDKYYPFEDNLTMTSDGYWSITTYQDPLTFFYMDDQTPDLTGGELYALASSAFKEEALEATDNMCLAIDWQAKYNGAYKSGTFYTEYFTLNVDDFYATYLDGTSLSLDQTHIYFGDE